MGLAAKGIAESTTVCAVVKTGSRIVIKAVVMRARVVGKVILDWLFSCFMRVFVSVSEILS